MLFSDIEGSTRLLGRLGDRYAEALDVQRSALRAAWRRWGGVEMGTEGDSFFVVFEAALDGVRAALQAQHELTETQWPGGEPVAVRMGLHTGEPVPHDGGYIGMDVHRAARVSAAAHGGQVVITAATRQLVADALSPHASVVDLGWHRLKDFADPAHLYQLTAPGLPERFPALRTVGASTSLPVELSPMVGRDDELAQLLDLVRRGVRLITLTGTGGSGKTRLATALAFEQSSSFVDGVFFVPLAGVSRGEEIWPPVMDALHVSGGAGSPRELLAQLSQSHLLLVLDNLEQIADAASVVAELLAAVPQLVLLATSRRPLRLRGEHEHSVRPLPLPEGVGVSDVAGSPAVRMFCQHAEMVRPGFALTAQNVADVAAVCRRLDGLPLALELAAARTRLLSPKALLAKLDSTLDLHGDAVDRPARHQALRDTIAWSYDLLSPELQVSFRSLGVFAGGADLQAAAAVALATPGEDPLDAVGELVESGLLTVAEQPGGEPRGHCCVVGSMAPLHCPSGSKGLTRLPSGLTQMASNNSSKARRTRCRAGVSVAIS
jgi:predicted ATPase/class 3 adenylate cyclase